MLRPAITTFIRRRAPNTNPRKKNSSAIGAITQTKIPAATSAAVLWLAPSSEGSLSLPCSLNSCAQIAVAT